MWFTMDRGAVESSCIVCFKCIAILDRIKVQYIVMLVDAAGVARPMSRSTDFKT